MIGRNDNPPTTQDGRWLPGWVILPIRLFLGFSFLKAGLDKLTDPTYLDPSAREYIGNQIKLMAAGTPIEGFLMNIAVPNANLFGVMVMGGELCIGIAILLGILTRFSALMGLFINLTFYLSATWNVHPFYFGADLPYAAGWLTLLLAGPGPFALDWVLRRWLAAEPAAALPKGHPASAAAQDTTMSRRTFVVGGGAALAGIALAATGIGWGILHPDGSTTTAAVPGNNQGGGPVGPPAPPTATVAPAPPTADTSGGATQPTAAPAEPSPTAAAAAPPAGAGALIAHPGELPVGQAGEFSLPNGDPAVLVHNDKGYSAYVAICTHQGCTVQPTDQGIFICPCHGAEFDETNGSVVRGPARQPLSNIPLVIGPDGTVYLGS